MASLYALYKMIAEQISFDELLQRIDRELFFLPDRITLEEYQKRLGSKKHREEKVGESVRLEFSYEINWHSIMPVDLLDLNPLLSQDFETPVRLTTRFQSDLIKSQHLSFRNGYAAEMFFELFKNNSNWDSYQLVDNTPATKSADGKYIITSSVYYEEFVTDYPVFRVVLFYN